MKIKKLEPSDLEKINSIELGCYDDNNNDLTEQSPLLIVKEIGDKKLCINEDFYYQNYDEIQKMLQVIAKNFKNYIFHINDPKLIDNRFIESLLDNKNVDYVNFDIMDKLTEEEWNLYCNSDSDDDFLKKIGISEELIQKSKNIQNRKPMTLYTIKQCLGNNTYDDLAEKENLQLTYIKEYQIKNLKYLKKDSIITFDSDSMDLNLIFRVINALQNLKNSPSKIIIQVKDKKLLNEYLNQNKNLNTDRIVINLSKELLDEITLDKYIEVEQKINEMVQPVLNYSPFEQFLYVYNLVAQFKEYKESEEKLKSSRSIYEIFDNEYIVCVGYANLLKELLDRLGIESKTIGVDVDDGFDKVKLNENILPEGIEVRKNGHERLIVNMVDGKYDINGYYISDPTWDNDLENKYYACSLMTANETISHKRYLFYDASDCMELFYSNNKEEFNEKMSLYVKKNNYSIISFYKELLCFLDIAIYDESVREKIFKVTGEFDLKNPPRFTKEEIIGINKNMQVPEHILKKIESYLENFSIDSFYQKVPLSEERILNELISQLMNVLKIIDNEFYLKIRSEFNIQSIDYYDYSIDDAKRILSYIGNYIITKSNKLINPNKFYNALEHLYKDVYQMENYKEYTRKVVDDNNDYYKHKFPYLDIIEVEQKINEMVQPVLNYSPFEQFLYVYNLVAQFKEYKESKGKSKSSRSIYEIFDNEYIACLGYASLLKKLLDRLGIEAKTIGLDVDNGFDEVELDEDILLEEIEARKNGHKGLIVNIIDNKYDINGYYISDPTCDNDLENKYNIYSLMTANETISNKRYNVSDCMELFYSNDKEEFNEKIALYIKKNNYSIDKWYKDLLYILDIAIYDESVRKKIFKVTGEIDLKNPPRFTKEEIIGIYKNMEASEYTLKKVENYLENYSIDSFYQKVPLSEERILNELISNIMELLKKIDNEFYLKIRSEFHILSKDYYDYSTYDAREILSYIGNYIITKSNKLINPNKFYNALEHLYKDVYQIENYKEYTRKVVDDNKECYMYKFPYVNLIDERQNIEETEINSENKYRRT